LSKQDPSTVVLEVLTQEQTRNALTSALTQKFTQAIPSRFFSVVEIQGYLLQYKNDPRSALLNAEDWVNTIKSQRLETRLRL
jgi:hypothetical protein